MSEKLEHREQINKHVKWIRRQEEAYGTFGEKFERGLFGILIMLGILGTVSDIFDPERTGIPLALLFVSVICWNQLVARQQRRAHLYTLLRAMGKAPHDGNVAS